MNTKRKNQTSNKAEYFKEMNEAVKTAKAIITELEYQVSRHEEQPEEIDGRDVGEASYLKEKLEEVLKNF